MLTEDQANRVWEKMVEAEVRSLYFADLATYYTRNKQIITASSFLLSSGAAATVAAHTSFWFPLVTSAVSAALSGYSIAVGLDRKAATMAKLHSSWNELHADYERLWYHWRDEDAEAQFDELQKRGRGASETGSIEAPYDVTRFDKWTDWVYEPYAQRAA
jgi:hypothetical protein